MRKQHEVIIEALENADNKYFTKRVWSLRLEYVNNFARRIFYHETAIISVIENTIILRNWWRKTNSTSQNLRGLVENIFNIKVLYDWKWVVDEFGIPHLREDDKIEMYWIWKSTFRANLSNLI